MGVGCIHLTLFALCDTHHCALDIYLLHRFDLRYCMELVGLKATSGVPPSSAQRSVTSKWPLATRWEKWTAVSTMPFERFDDLQGPLY